MNDHIRTYKGVLTVAQLKQIISGLPEDTQIVIASPISENENWHLSGYWNVEQVDRPDFDELHAITLTLSDTFDPRQF